jgi:hypothetical protein
MWLKETQAGHGACPTARSSGTAICICIWARVICDASCYGVLADFGFLHGAFEFARVARTWPLVDACWYVWRVSKTTLAWSMGDFEQVGNGAVCSHVVLDSMMSKSTSWAHFPSSFA